MKTSILAGCSDDSVCLCIVVERVQNPIFCCHVNLFIAESNYIPDKVGEHVCEL
jgi:hypothetical protein